MRRTQIYLDIEQGRLLGRLAEEQGTTRSALIRVAIDRFLESKPDPAERLTRFRRAVADVAGIAPALPDGKAYVEEIRRADTARLKELDDRRDS